MINVKGVRSKIVMCSDQSGCSRDWWGKLTVGLDSLFRQTPDMLGQYSNAFECTDRVFMKWKENSSRVIDFHWKCSNYSIFIKRNPIFPWKCSIFIKNAAISTKTSVFLKYPAVSLPRKVAANWLLYSILLKMILVKSTPSVNSSFHERVYTFVVNWSNFINSSLTHPILQQKNERHELYSR